jgi:simple sugar transport system ATP-binding protein
VNYGEFRAINNVSVNFERGKVHAVLGQNGAGKTTFGRALMGLVRPSSGSITIDGQSVAGKGVVVARSAGIDMVHQIFTLPPSMTVAEALEFYCPHGPSLQPYSKKKLESLWSEKLRELEVFVDTNSVIGNLPIETVQSLEIARALVADAQILILDEPTASISPQDAEKLFERLGNLAAKGLTVIVVLHKVREVLAVSDTVTVLRAGDCVLHAEPAGNFDEVALSSAIMGNQRVAITDRSSSTGSKHVRGSEILGVLGISTQRLEGDGDAPLNDITLSVAGGEIVGVAGVEGNGQVSLVSTIVGLRNPIAGRIYLEGDELTNESVGKRRRRGLRVIPFDRMTEGVSASRTLWENVAAGALVSSPDSSPMVNPSQLRSNASRALDLWGVRYQSVNQMAGELSGGNVQRLIFAREVDEHLRLLVAAQPSRGLDVGATVFVHETLRELRSRGAGIVLVSSDLDELIDLSDRICVMRAGSLVKTFEAPFDFKELGAVMVGAS